MALLSYLLAVMTKYNITAIVKDKRGRILGVGRNSYVKTHPLQARASEAVGGKNRTFLHAEVAALLKVKDWNKAYALHVFRFDSQGNPALAKPCSCCQWVINQTAIKKVIHT